MSKLFLILVMTLGSLPAQADGQFGTHKQDILKALRHGYEMAEQWQKCLSGSTAQLNQKKCSEAKKHALQENAFKMKMLKTRLSCLEQSDSPDAVETCFQASFQKSAQRKAAPQ